MCPVITRRASSLSPRDNQETPRTPPPPRGGCGGWLGVLPLLRRGCCVCAARLALLFGVPRRMLCGMIASQPLSAAGVLCWGLSLSLTDPPQHTPPVCCRAGPTMMMRRWLSARWSLSAWRAVLALRCSAATLLLGLGGSLSSGWPAGQPLTRAPLLRASSRLADPPPRWVDRRARAASDPPRHHTHARTARAHTTPLLLLLCLSARAGGLSDWPRPCRVGVCGVACAVRCPVVGVEVVVSPAGRSHTPSRIPLIILSQLSLSLPWLLVRRDRAAFC